MTFYVVPPGGSTGPRQKARLFDHPKKIPANRIKQAYHPGLTLSAEGFPVRIEYPYLNMDTWTANHRFNIKLCFPTMPSVSPRQDTWLTRLDPRPQIKGTLYWVPVQ